MMVLQLASTVIIARVLTPAEIGIFGIAAVFSTLASMFRDFGVGEYLIQERELTKERIASALTLNITVSWLMAAAMYLGSPAVASFYANDGVGEVMRVQAIGFLLVPFGAVTMAWFRRELNYTPILMCNVGGNVTSFAVSVGLALMGHGYMSLAWATVAAIAVTVTMSVLYRPGWFPRWPSLQHFWEVFHFSKFASLVYIVGQVGKGSPEMIIGRVQGVADVAMFSRANGLVEMFNRLAMRPVMMVCMPMYARADHANQSVAEVYVRSVSYLTAVGWPFLAFLGIASFSAIRIVYGPQWDIAIPLAKILCLACAIELVHAMSREALLARGLARDANSLQMILVALQVGGLLLVIPFGLTGAAWGMAAAAAVGLVTAQWFLARGIGLTIRDLMRGCAPSLAISVIAVFPAGLWALSTGVGEQNFVAFGLVGGGVTALCWLLALKLLAHPILNELAPIVVRVRAWAGRV